VVALDPVVVAAAFEVAVATFEADLHDLVDLQEDLITEEAASVDHLGVVVLADHVEALVDHRGVVDLPDLEDLVIMDHQAKTGIMEMGMAVVPKEVSVVNEVVVVAAALVDLRGVEDLEEVSGVEDIRTWDTVWGEMVPQAKMMREEGMEVLMDHHKVWEEVQDSGVRVDLTIGVDQEWGDPEWVDHLDRWADKDLNSSNMGVKGLHSSKGAEVVVPWGV